MVTHKEKQQMIRSADDARAHARMVLAKCVAGLAAVALIALAGVVFAPGGGDVRTAKSAGGEPPSTIDGVSATACSPEGGAAQACLKGVR